METDRGEYTVTNREDVRLYIKELDEEEKHAHREIEIDYILYGSAELVLSGDSFYMKKGDIILINSNKLHWWQRMKDCLVCRILISASMMEKMLGKHSVSFWCNSVTNSERDVDRLRIILNSLIKKYRAAGKRGSFSLECSKYLLLESLSENFLVETQETGNGIEDQRVQNAIGYINEHYAEHLSLVRIAETLYLSESYLSRLFKNIVGMNFREYLSRVRLNHAVESLLYTEKSITDISLECGFENPSSFNKLFKKNYNCSPSEYKRSMRRKRKEESKNDDRINELLDEWIKKEENKREQDEPEQKVIQIKQESGRFLRDNTIRWLNFGTASDLLQGVLQEQLLQIHKLLGIQYIRLENIFTGNFYMRQGRGSNRYTFALMDIILDFLVDNGMIPVLDMTVHFKEAYADIGEELFREKGEILFQDTEDWRILLENYFRHLEERYGRENVEDWIFELDDSKEYSDVCEIYGKEHVPYVELWGTARKVMNRFCPRAELGGSMELLKSGKLIPDFITHKIYPYGIHAYEKDVYSGRITDSYFIENEIKKIRRQLENAGYSDMKLVITEWNTSISERNAYNDSCGKAAHIMTHLVKLEGENCILCYQHGSDFLSQYMDTTRPLVGGNGLLTKDGIYKPVFYSFLFMSQMKGKIVEKGDNFLITCNRENEYYILAFQPEKFSHVYYLNKESQITEEMLDNIYEDQAEQRMEFEILNCEKSKYRMKTWYMTEEEGSTLYEWRKMGKPEQISPDEVQHLRALCRPRIQKKSGEIWNGQYDFEIILKAHQITLVQIIMSD